MTLPFLVEWQPESMLPHPGIVECRQRLSDLYREIGSALEAQGGAPRGLVVLLESLQLALGDHFRIEEAVLAACDYPLLARHQEEHAVYLAGLHNLIETGRRGKLNPHVLHEWLAAWWSDHMLGSDQRYALAIQGEMQRSG